MAILRRLDGAIQSSAKDTKYRLLALRSRVAYSGSVRSEPTPSSCKQLLRGTNKVYFRGLQYHPINSITIIPFGLHYHSFIQNSCLYFYCIIPIIVNFIESLSYKMYTSNSQYGAHYSSSLYRSPLDRSPSKRSYGLSPSKSRYPKGLQNLTNTCYISSVLQVLFQIINKSDFPIKAKSQQITNLFYNLKESKQTRDYKKLKEALQDRIQIVRGWQQQDSHQFFIEMIELFLRENCERPTSNKFTFVYRMEDNVSKNWDNFIKDMNKIEKSKIIDLFYGEMIKTLRCPYGHEKCTIERYSNLSLPLSQKSNSYSSSYSRSPYNYYSSYSSYSYDQPLTLQDTIQAYLKQEQIDDVECQKCRKKQRFTRSTSLYTLPKYFILHLSRFIKGNYNNQKNTKEIKFDENISIQQEYSQKRRVPYSLMAVIHHLGNLNRGHYFCDVKINDQWYQFDDQTVRPSKISRSGNTSNSAYILIYKRV